MDFDNVTTPYLRDRVLALMQTDEVPKRVSSQMSPYDWRNYINPWVADVWPLLTERERLLRMLDAHEKAQDALNRAG